MPVCWGYAESRCLRWCQSTWLATYTSSYVWSACIIVAAKCNLQWAGWYSGVGHMGVWTACIVDPQPAKGWFGRGSYWSQVRLGYRLKSFLSLQFWDQGNLWNQNKVAWEGFMSRLLKYILLWWFPMVKLINWGRPEVTVAKSKGHGCGCWWHWDGMGGTAHLHNANTGGMCTRIVEWTSIRIPTWACRRPSLVVVPP